MLECNSHRLFWLLLQFSLLNGSTHDMWLQQGHEHQDMDEHFRRRCEVLMTKKDTEGRRVVKASEVCCHSLAVDSRGLIGVQQQLQVCRPSYATADAAAHAVALTCMHKGCDWSLVQIMYTYTVQLNCWYVLLCLAIECKPVAAGACL